MFQKSGYHQLRLVVFFPIIFKVSYIPGGCWGFFYQQYEPAAFSNPGTVDSTP